MSQGLALGITVGSSNTVAVTTSGGHSTTHIRPSALVPEQELPESFLSRVGDPVDIRTRDGSAVRAADLVAAAIGRVVDDLDAAAATIACYPAWWSQHTVEVQRDALAAAGLDGVALVPEPAAAMRWLQEVHESTHDGAMVVYDLGTTGLTVSVARTGAMSGLLGEPVRSTTVAGAEFDLLAMRYVLAFAVGENDFDPFDPRVEQELADLRVRCKIAKETLSKQTATVVPVRLPDLGPVDVRLVRDEFEDLVRNPLLTSTDLVREAVRRAGLTVAELDGILLTGGGAAIPLVTELLSTEFGIPVATAADPAHLSAHGAALLAADLLTDTTPTEPHPSIASPLAGLARPGIPARRDPGSERANDLRSNSFEYSAAESGTPGAGLPGHPSGAFPRTDRNSDDGPGARELPVSHSAERTPAAEESVSDKPRALPTLPTDDEQPTGFAHWKRVAVMGAVAVAIAALATGTLAMGTGVQSAPPESSGPQAPSTTVAALDNADPQTGGSDQAGTTGQAAPIAGVGPTTAGRPAGSNPAAGAGNPSPGAAPTTAGAAATEPAAPAGQPETTAPPQLPAAQQPQLPSLPQPELKVPTVPSLPSVPGVLNGTVDQLGDAVPALPTQVLPRTGG
ncbi:Hsp70 family protein [Nocardia sp. 2]|uniref:Hsp70 family protein n=1 Tax=Nocardia acididurans TaxID=2802282 RepID=A0ABS1LX81_9NOCA|nr:Hsp70 family protein [Nocardia acididurans]MBL1072933.1 Hsp70 family protein [Nocardia acididurans]